MRKPDLKYFTKGELGEAFGYASRNSFISSRSHDVMMAGIAFVVKRVENSCKAELEELKAKLRELGKE